MKLILLLAGLGIAIAAPSVPETSVRTETSKATVLDDLTKTNIRSNEIVRPIREEQGRGFDSEQVKEEVQRVESTTAARVEQVHLDQSRIEQARGEEPPITTPLPLPNRADLQNFMILVPLDHLHNIINLNNVRSRFIPHPDSVRNAIITAARNFPAFAASYHANSRLDGQELSGSIGNSLSGLMGHTEFGAGFSAPNPVGRLLTTLDQTVQGRPIVPQPQRKAQAQASFSVAQPIGLRAFLPSFLLSAQAATNA